MKKFLILVVLLMTGNLTSAQNAKNIIGKWAYVELDDPSELDDVGKEMAVMMFKDLVLNFRADNSMSITMRKTPENGTYAFDKNNENLINSTSASGKVMPLTIIKLTENELTIKLGNIGAMKMKKASAVPDAAPAIIPKVSATMNQMTGKWYVIGSDGEKFSELAAEMMKDSYVYFGEDGLYEANILSIEQQGTWEFGEGNTTIDVIFEDDMGIWSIYKVSENELVMQNDTSVKKMIFGRKQ